MHFVMGLPVLINWKGESYDLILVIIDQLTNMIHYKVVKVTIDIPGLAKVIINIVVCYHEVSESIITDQDSLYTLKF